MHKIIFENENFFRYDLKEPPRDWDDSFTSGEYIHDQIGEKNKAGLFFFTNSEEIAKKLGRNAVQKNKEGYFLTRCETVKRIKIIDFSCCDNIYQMLRVLMDLNIDVLNDDFRTCEESNGRYLKTFSFLREHLEAFEEETEDHSKRLKILQNIKLDPKSDPYDVRLFGQRLTDFDNGLHFKAAVLDSNPDIDGYRWKEFPEEGWTYCLFEPKKLTPPTKEFLSI